MEYDRARHDIDNAGELATRHPEYVWFWKRASARLIDIAYYYIVSIFVGFVVAVILIVMDQMNGTNLIQRLQDQPSITLAGFLLGNIAIILYHTILEGIHGSTLGKLILGLTVLDTNLRPCGPTAAALRSIAVLADGLVFGGVAAMSMQNSDTNQRLGDRWAKTVVVRRKSAPRESLRSPVVFFSSFLLGSLVVATLVALTVVVKL